MERDAGEPAMSSDKFWPCDLSALCNWVLRGLDQGEVLGVHRGLFFAPQADDPFRMERYGQVLETPLGVAAGPTPSSART